MKILICLITLFLLLVPSLSNAQCTNPAGVAGEEFYNSSEKVFQYCNGDDWVAMICNNEPDIEPADCSLPWGGTILHNSNVTAYQNATEPFGGSCVSESRVCNNGALSGSYVNQNCSVSPPADCTAPWGATISHGSDVVAYQNATEPFGGSCTSETRTCNNGALGGSFTSQNCSVLPAADCTAPWGATVSHSASVTAFQNATVPSGNSCLPETRTCNNGTLDGAFTNQNCTVAPVTCTLPWGGSINEGQSVVAYISESAPSCTPNSRTCGSNGILDGTINAVYETCTVTDPCSGSPAIGTVCANGTIYAGLSPDGYRPMFTTGANVGVSHWNNGSTTGYQFVGATSFNDGDGNTFQIGTVPTPHDAAQRCIDLNFGSRSDWYLPSIQELNVLYQGRASIGISPGSYWSSSENGAMTVWTQRFSDGFTTDSSKHPVFTAAAVP